MDNSLLLIPYWVNSGNTVSVAYQMLRGCIRDMMTVKAKTKLNSHMSYYERLIKLHSDANLESFKKVFPDSHSSANNISGH